MNLPLIIAHRGARSLAPENTLSAAMAGLDCGADMWELDVALSRDGCPVILHDDSLKRTTDVCKKYPHRKPWLISDFTLAELLTLDAGGWFLERDPFHQISSGSLSSDSAAKFRGEKIPTLKQALSFTARAGWKVNVEIKHAHREKEGEELVRKVVDEFHSSGLKPDQVIISSFNHQYLLQVHQIDDSIPLAALVETPVLDPIKLVKEFHAVAFNPWSRFAPSRQIKHVVSHGVQVFCWTVNSKREAIRLARAGVTGIITDFPQLMREYLL